MVVTFPATSLTVFGSDTSPEGDTRLENNLRVRHRHGPCGLVRFSAFSDDGRELDAGLAEATKGEEAE